MYYTDGIQLSFHVYIPLFLRYSTYIVRICNVVDICMSQKKNQRKKGAPKRNLSHVVEAEAQRLAHERNPAKNTSSKSTVSEDIVSKKTEEYAQLHAERVSFIKKDAVKSVIFGTVFLSLIGLLYMYDQSSAIIESVSQSFLSFVLS